MSTFDSKVAQEVLDGAFLDHKDLDTIINPDNFDEDACLCSQLVERYACNADYTVDLPVYLLLRGKTYLGAIVGERSAESFRKDLRALIDGAKDTKGESSPT